MKSAQHTPGPWKFNDASLTVHAPKPHSKIIAFMPDVYNDDPTRETICANAALISSAPDLLAALEQLVMGNAAEDNSDWDKGIRMARAAIAKATGESP